MRISLPGGFPRLALLLSALVLLAVGGLPGLRTGGLVGALPGAATGAALSYMAHQAYCGETSSCGNYPDRSFRDPTLVGAGIGLLPGIGIEGLIVDRRERERAREESGAVSQSAGDR